MRDALLEVWQANAAGIYAHPEGGGEVERGFRGWGRVITDFATGEWAFETVKPGPVPARVPAGARAGAGSGPGSGEVRTAEEERRDAHGRGHQGLRAQAPHISLWIVARGVNVGLSTRLYFSDEAKANAADPVLGLIEPEARRRTLIAARGEGGAVPVYRFDVCLQGSDETVFFDV